MITRKKKTRCVTDGFRDPTVGLKSVLTEQTVSTAIKVHESL